jgi:hypothetical protein
VDADVLLDGQVEVKGAWNTTLSSCRAAARGDVSSVPAIMTRPDVGVRTCR